MCLEYLKQNFNLVYEMEEVVTMMEMVQNIYLELFLELKMMELLLCQFHSLLEMDKICTIQIMNSEVVLELVEISVFKEIL